MSVNKSCRVIDKNFTRIVKLHRTAHSDYKAENELFKKLLKQYAEDKDFDINYRVSAGNSSYQTVWMEDHTIFQLVYTDIDLCQALIDNGANYLVTDKEGSTVLLQETTSYGYRSYLNGMRKTETSYANFILLKQIKSGNSTNPKSKSGLSHFHVACMYNLADAAKFFLENGVLVNETVSSNSKFYPGFSALHFAVKSGALKTVEVLLSFDADMFAPDSGGQSPLHLLIVERKKKIVALQKLLRMPDTNRKNSSCSEFQNYCDINLKIFHLFLKSMSERGFNVDNVGLSYLHVLCFVGDTVAIEQFLDNYKEYLTQPVSIDSPIWSGYTPLHFAAHSNVEVVKLLVKNGADLSAKDANGETPFNICLREFLISDVERILSLYPHYSNITFTNNKTNLPDFFHAMQDIGTLKKYLKSHPSIMDPDSFIPFDSPICAGYTALHLMIICTEQPMNWCVKDEIVSDVFPAEMESEQFRLYLSRINTYLRHNPDVTSRDAKGSTPLHWAFKLRQNQVVHMLLARHDSNFNPVDEHGLSHLHIACAAGNETVVRKLLSEGANVNEVATPSYSSMAPDIAMSRLDGVARFKKCFVDKSSTPLHFASSVQCLKIVEILIDNGADVLLQDASGLNPLERVFEAPIFQDAEWPKLPRLDSFDENKKEIIKLLVRRIGDRLVDTKPKQMLCCYSVLKRSFLDEVLSHGDASTMKILESVGITQLHVASYTRNLERVCELAEEMDVNARVDLESPLWPGCTPLHLLAKAGYQLEATPTNRSILEKLLQAGADVAAVNARGDTPIHQIFWHGRLLIDETLNHLKDFSINPVGTSGFTHLHIASRFGVAPIVEKLLEHGAVVDQTTDYFVENFAGFSALHFAAFFQQESVVDVLLKHGADVNWRNACGGNPLHTANRMGRQPCLELLQTLISAGTDINAKNMHGETPLEALLKSSDRTEEEIQLFLSPDGRFNTFNLMSDEGFLAVALNEQVSVYEKAVKAPHTKEIDVNGRNAMHNVVSFKRPDWIEIEEEEEIDDTYTPSDVYIREIGSLMKMGLNINQQDSQGMTPLHLAARMQNVTGIIGLLANGADINITDADDKPAIAYSLELAELYRGSTYSFIQPKKFMKLDLRILKVISTHLHKLSMVRVRIDESTREFGAKICEIKSFDASEIEKCNDEIERMREEKIDSTSITFYEFLSDTGAVSNFSYFLFHQRTAIDYNFKNNVESFREKFPAMTGILLLQYRKALARCDIIDSAVSSLNYLVNFNIPPNLSKIILRFLDNEELNILIRSTTAQ